MNAYFEIAYAAVTHRLCLFTGTGFSKAVTNNVAPGWQQLLEMACDRLPNGVAIKAALFPAGGVNPLTLEEAAQVIDLELTKSLKTSIHEVIAADIGALTPAGDNSVIADFLQKNPLRIITTNYDKLVETLVGPDTCQSISPGFPIPRAGAKTKVYHVHGSIDSPKNMVVSSDDYFKFMLGESYFSRKLSTALHENTVVILGYSLADTNLKTILSDYKGFSRTHAIGGNLFLVSRNKVNQHVKDYYAHCYGIRVLDNLEVKDFFLQVNARMTDAAKYSGTASQNINKVLFQGHHYKDEYLKVESSFYEIVASVAGIGRSINDPLVVAALDKIIQSKIQFTSENGAWGQYEQLAKWLCYLGTILELPGTSVEKTFLAAVTQSMNSMSKTRLLGYSWHAYGAWNSSWSDLLAPNRAVIRQHVEANCWRPDAIELVSQG